MFNLTVISYLAFWFKLLYANSQLQSWESMLYIVIFAEWSLNIELIDDYIPLPAGRIHRQLKGRPLGATATVYAAAILESSSTWQQRSLSWLGTSRWGASAPGAGHHDHSRAPSPTAGGGVPHQQVCQWMLGCDRPCSVARHCHISGSWPQRAKPSSLRRLSSPIRSVAAADTL
jgi:hypothetical protein